MKRAHETARKNLKTSIKGMKRAYDLRVLLRPYKEGDIVYLLDTASHKGKSHKLSSPWKGPGIITNKLSVYLYRIMLRNAVLVTNHDRMMPCKDRKLPGWIVKFYMGGCGCLTEARVSFHLTLFRLPGYPTGWEGFIPSTMRPSFSFF